MENHLSSAVTPFDVVETRSRSPGVAFDDLPTLPAAANQTGLLPALHPIAVAS
jgi:hypothetical protein